MNEGQVLRLVTQCGATYERERSSQAHTIFKSKDSLMAFANACCAVQREKDASICDKQAYSNGIAKDCAWAIRANKGELK